MFFIFITQNICAQNIRLFLQKDNTSVKVKQKQTFKNTTEAEQYLKSTQQKLIQQGYLEASFDSIRQQHDSVLQTCIPGKNMR